MPDLYAQLESMIDTPDKARAIKKYLASVDPNTLSPDDRAGYRTAHRALTRWVNPAPENPNADVYNYPRQAGDVISNQGDRPTVTEIKPEQIRDTDPTVGEHGVTVIKGLASLAGAPTSSEEWKREFSLPTLGKRAVTGPLYPQLQGFEASRAAWKRGDKLEGIPVVGPTVVTPVKSLGKIVGPTKAYFGENRAPTREEALDATRVGTQTTAALVGARKPLSRSEMGGFNKVLNPEGTVAGSIARAQQTVGKNVSTVRRKYTPEAKFERARRMADVAEKSAGDISTAVAAVTGPQARARTAMNLSDAAIGQSKSARKMAKREKAFEKTAPNKINNRLNLVVDDMETRLARGDDPGLEALATYRKTGIPRNPEIIKADKQKVHKATQARLSEPDMQAINVPEEVVINSLTRETIKRATAPIGDSPSSHSQLREIIEKANTDGKISPADYDVLRSMAEGDYVTGVTKNGTPILGKVDMPDMLSTTIGYIERLRRQHGGRLPSTPLELNTAKATRYKEIPDRAFESDFTEAEKSRHSIARGQAMGLRKLVDEVTTGPGGQSQITELNRKYANLSVLETGMRNWDVASSLSSPIPPMVVAGNVSATPSGASRMATGAGVGAMLTKKFRNIILSPQYGLKYALASESMAKARGLERPPAKPKAGSPPPGGNIPGTPASPAGPTGGTPLVRQAFYLARNNELKKLSTLWKEHYDQFRVEINPSEFQKIDKMVTEAKDKAAVASAPTTVSAPLPKPTPPAPARKDPNAAHQALMNNVRTDVSKAVGIMKNNGIKVPKSLSDIADKAELVTEVPAAEPTPIKQVVSKPPTKPTSTPAPSKKESAPPAVKPAPPPAKPKMDLDPLAKLDKTKGDWREVKSVESVKPAVKERPVQAVNITEMDKNTLADKISEWETGRTNAVKLNDKSRVAWYDKKLAEAKNQLGGATPVGPPAPAPEPQSYSGAKSESWVDDADTAVLDGSTVHIKRIVQTGLDGPRFVVLEGRKDSIPASKLTPSRSEIQKMIDRSAKLKAAGKSEQAAELLNLATEFAEKLGKK